MALSAANAARGWSEAFWAHEHVAAVLGSGLSLRRGGRREMRDESRTSMAQPSHSRPLTSRLGPKMSSGSQMMSSVGMWAGRVWPGRSIVRWAGRGERASSAPRP